MKTGMSNQKLILSAVSHEESASYLKALRKMSENRSLDLKDLTATIRNELYSF